MTSYPHFLVAISAVLFATVAPAQNKDSRAILIGQTFVETGPLASLSSEPLIGIRAMLNEVNTRGGIKGRPLELRQLDDAYDTAKAEENVKKFADAGAIAVLMPIGTSSAVGAIKAANQLKIPLIGAYTGAAPVVKFSEYSYPVRVSFDEEYRRIIDHLFTVGTTRIAFAHNDNPGARSAMEATKGFIEQRGQKMLTSVALKQDGSDAEDKAKALAKVDAQVIVLSATNPVVAKLIKAYRANSGAAQFYSFSFLNGKTLFKNIDVEASGTVISQVVPLPTNANIAIVAKYQAAMKKINQVDFSYGSLEGYIAAHILVMALERAGPNPGSASVKKALDNFQTIDIGGLELKYTPQAHHGLSFSELVILAKDGRYIR
jgi:branched-chain amino acid transport system substrate-binding protein